MPYKIVDTHCHLHDEKFNEDLEDVLTRAAKANVAYFITIGCDIETTKRALKLAEERQNIFFQRVFIPMRPNFSTKKAWLF